MEKELSYMTFATDPEKMVSDLALHLKFSRKSMKVSQAELARRMGTKQPAIARMESGRIDSLGNYLKALGCLDVRIRTHFTTTVVED